MLKIALILDNAERELLYLRHLSNVIKKNLPADVKIFGSIAELERIKYLLYRNQPEVVIVSQIFEQSCQELAHYVRESGAILVVIPCELRVSPAYELLVENKKNLLDLFVDYVFLSGNVLKELFEKTDIQKHKLIITGSPKIDIALQQNKLNRKDFLNKYNINKNRKNIFFFTSFVQSNLEFLKKDKLYKNHLEYKIQFNKAVEVVRQIYLDSLLQLANAESKINIIIKPHPLEKTNYQSLVSQSKHSNVYLVHAPLEDCYNSIDLAVHWLSTVALECWLRDIPVIEFFPGGFSTLLPDFKSAHPVITEPSELEDAVNTYLKKPIEKKYKNKQTKILQDNFFSVDSHSALRIAEILKKVLPNNIVVSYKNSASTLAELLYYTEVVVGVKASRKLVKIFKPMYESVYAMKNYVNE